MGTTDATLTGLNEIHGIAKPDDVGMGEWVWEALQGDFNPRRSTGQIGFDMVVSLVPIVDTVCDLRDLCANIKAYRKEPTDKVTLFFMATTVVGFFPELGTVVKSVLRLMWVHMKPLIRHADNITNVSKLMTAANRACDAALPRITEYLQHNRVTKWATSGKLADIYKFVAKSIREAAEKISLELMSRLLNEKFNALKLLLGKISPIVPTKVQERINHFLEYLNGARRSMSQAIQHFVQPVRTVLNVVAKRLDDHAWRADIRQTNRGWIAPLSASGSTRLINAIRPKWASPLSAQMAFPPLNANREEMRALMKAYPKHPALEDWIVSSFAKKGGGMRAGAITGPAKLYRVVDPSNEGGGIFWMTETEFKALKNRDEWRSRFAVKPEWNQNGWFVEYEVKAGESLPVWRGPVASQKVDGTDYYLKGGHEQIVFFPSSRDHMVNGLPRIDPNTGLPIVDKANNIDRRVEFTDVTGEPVLSKLRKEITDPRIKGPFETGWGASDYSPEEAHRILLTVPRS